MKFDGREYIKDFLRFCRDNKKTALAVIALSVAVILLQAASGLNRGERYLTDENGKVTGLTREDSEGASVPLKVKAVKDKLSAEEEVTVYLSDGHEQRKKADEKTPEDELSMSLSDAVAEVENSTQREVTLPGKLDDGTKVYWYKDMEHPDYIIVFMALPVMILLYKSKEQKHKRQTREAKDKVLKALPAFNNQLLILLNCGLIFNDSFIRIAEGYRKGGGSDPLKETVVAIKDKSCDTNSSLVTVLDDFSRKLGVKEFSRISAIISDNQYKGVDLTEKLESESDILWNQRKKLAEEKGRLAETKLSFPLALLLLVLILITAAPAILQI